MSRIHNPLVHVGVGVTGPRSRAAQRRATALAGVAAVCVAFAVVTAGAMPQIARGASVPNACKLLGITRSVAVRAYGKGAVFGDGRTSGGTPPNLGAYCDLGQGLHPVRLIGSISAEPYSSTEFSALVAGYGSGAAKTRLTHLGRGAMFFHERRDPSTDAVVFEHGKIAVLLSSEEAGGQPADSYPTEKMYLTVARAVYAHLR